MCGQAARVVAMDEPPTWTARCFRQVVLVGLGKPAQRMMPALFTTTSTPSNRSNAVSTSAAAPAAEDTSLPSAIASPPAATISATADAGPGPHRGTAVEAPRSLTTTAPALGEQARVGTAEAASRTRDDGGAPVEAALVASLSGTSDRHRGLVPQEVAQRAADQGLALVVGQIAELAGEQLAAAAEGPSACG